MKRNHPIKYEEFKSFKEPNGDNQLKLNLLPTSIKKYPPNDSHQHNITDELMSFIVGDLLPLSVVESSKFRNFICKLDPKYQMPTRKHLSTKLIKENIFRTHENITKKVEQVHSIALTTDLWSNRQMKSYIGITGHLILDWKINSIMVACHRFSGRHSACNIYDKFQETIASFEISNKISAIITDNAYNMVNAFSLPGFDTIQKESDQSDSEDEIDISSDPYFELEGDILALLPPVRNSCLHIHFSL